MYEAELTDHKELNHYIFPSDCFGFLHVTGVVLFAVRENIGRSKYGDTIYLYRKSDVDAVWETFEDMFRNV